MSNIIFNNRRNPIAFANKGYLRPFACLSLR